jgi:hypothetical protein
MSFVLVASIYLILIVLLPTNTKDIEDGSITYAQYKSLLVLLAMPILTVWYGAFYGSAKLRAYARSIPKAPESRAFGQMSDSVTWLSWSLPLIAIFTVITVSVSYNYPSLSSVSTIAMEYIQLIVVLTAFVFLGNSARNLIGTTKVNFSSVPARFIATAFITVAVFFCYNIFTGLDSKNLVSMTSDFKLPLWLVITTIIIPSLLAWFIGLTAIYELRAYGLRVSGLLYRQSFSLLSLGLTAVIASVILLQYIDTSMPANGNELFGIRLAITMALSLVAGGGFFLLTRGAGGLKRIEDV